MLFRAVRSYSIKNLFINRDIVYSKERKYKAYKKPNNNIYLIRKNNAKQKRKIF